MATARFRNLAQYGVITEIPYPDLPVNAWTDALNVRFDNGRIVNIGGWNIVSRSSCIGDQTPYTLVHIPLSNGKYYYASNKFIYSIFPNNSYDPTDPTSSPEVRYNVTPRDTNGVAIPDYDTHTDLPLTTKVMNYSVDKDSRWNSTTIAERIVFNCNKYEPIGQKDGTFGDKDPFVVLPGWGVPDSTQPSQKATWRAKRIHAYKDHLMALNMTEGTTGSPTSSVNIPNRLRWSDIAFENQLPQNWYEDGGEVDDSGNPQYKGGFVDFMDATSPIIDGAPLRDYFMVYTNSETYMVNFVGGTFEFQNQKLFNDAGMLAEGCVAEYDGQHIVVTADDVIIHDGSQKSSLIQGTIRDRLLSEISSVNPLATRVFTNPVRREVWVCYIKDVTGVDTTRYACNQAAVYNFTSKTWTFTDLPDIYDAVMGEVKDPTPIATWDAGSSLQPVNVPWNNSPESWNINIVQMGSETLFAASDKHCLLNIDNGNKKIVPNFTDSSDPTKFDRYDDGFVQRFVERRMIDMDEVVEEYNRVKTWRTIYPQLGSSGQFFWKLSGLNVPNGQRSIRPASIFTVGVNYKVDCRWSKRYIDVRISTYEEAEWEFSTYDVDYVVEGRR